MIVCSSSLLSCFGHEQQDEPESVSFFFYGCIGTKNLAKCFVLPLVVLRDCLAEGVTRSTLEEEPPEQRRMEDSKLLEARLDRVRCLTPLPQARVLFRIVKMMLMVGWGVTSALVWLAQVFRVMCSKLEAPMDTGQAALNRMGEEMQLNLPSKPFTVAKTEQGGSTLSHLLPLFLISRSTAPLTSLNGNQERSFSTSCTRPTSSWRR